MPEEKNDRLIRRIQTPSSVTNPVNDGKVVNAEDEIFSLGNLIQEEQSDDRKEVKKKRKKKRWKKSNAMEDGNDGAETLRGFVSGEQRKGDRGGQNRSSSLMGQTEGKSTHGPQNPKAQYLIFFGAIGDRNNGLDLETTEGRSEPVMRRFWSLSQEDPVKIYGRDLISLLVKAPEQEEKGWEKAFMIGSRVKMRTGTMVFESRNLEKMMTVAKMVEDWFGPAEETPESFSEGSGKGNLSGPNRSEGPVEQVGRGSSDGPQNSKPTNSFGSSKNHHQSQGGDSRNSNFHDRVVPPFRRLTPAGIVQRKEDDLCYRCDEKWHRRHLCPKKELRILVVQEDGSEREWEESDGYKDGEENRNETAGVAELSLNSIVGISSPRTMKLKGSIQSEEVVIMIDSGATHNLISESLVKRLGLATEPTGGYGVVMGTGITVQGQSRCSAVELKLQEFHDGRIGGHGGVLKTQKRMGAMFY